MTPFDLPSEVLEVLPSDPFEQLDLARKITSVALFTRISALESESSVLRDQLADRDVVVEDLQAQVESLNVALSEVVDKLSRADQQKEVLLNENASLSEQVKKLNRDVAKLESFRKTLMMSLQDEDGSSAKDPPLAALTAPNHTSLSAQSITGDEETPPLPSPSIMSHSSDVQSSVQNSYQDEPVTDVPRPRISPGLLLASQTSTPRLTPPGSPPSLSASGSPKRTSKPVSPRRHSISFGPPRSMSDDRSSVYSSASSSPYGSMSGGRTRVDGKEFFRQVRGRLSYEQFSAFLANVKELNSHKQTKEDTLQKADDIFGPENKDLYAIFEGLISRNVH